MNSAGVRGLTSRALAVGAAGCQPAVGAAAQYLAISDAWLSVSSMTIQPLADVGSWFRERLDGALERRSIEASAEVRAYLAGVLTRGAGGAFVDLDDPIVLALDRALRAEALAERLERFREAGDRALVLSGFFAERLEHRGIARDYVVALGGRAFHGAHEAARRRHQPAQVYVELAGAFGQWASVLDEVRELTVLKTPQDIVRLYDRFRRTRSPEVAARLVREGVFPGRGNGTVH